MTACSAGDGSTGGRHTGGRMTGSLLRPRGRADASRSVLPTTNQVNLTGPLGALQAGAWRGAAALAEPGAQGQVGGRQVVVEEQPVARVEAPQGLARWR